MFDDHSYISFNCSNIINNCILFAEFSYKYIKLAYKSHRLPWPSGLCVRLSLQRLQVRAPKLPSRFCCYFIVEYDFQRYIVNLYNITYGLCGVIGQVVRLMLQETHTYIQKFPNFFLVIKLRFKYDKLAKYYCGVRGLVR